MRTSSVLHRGRRAAGVVALAALMLLGSGATPASAGSTRDKQWFLDAMQAEAMWQTSTGKGITVAVLDTGVDPDNPDLKGRVLDGRDFAPPSRSGDEHTDYNGHGTGMAGLIALRRERTTAGTGPSAWHRRLSSSRFACRMPTT